ncbi:hypothetical protein Droror1_Dr00025442 [Drosera rotundifolia]
MQVLTVLPCHGLLVLVDGTSKRPTGSDHDPDVSTWLRLDQMILAWVASSLSKSVLPQVIHCSSPHEIWQTLETLYGTISRARIQSVNYEHHSLSKGSLSISAYTYHTRALARTLILATESMFDADLVFLLPAVLDYFW